MAAPRYSNRPRAGWYGRVGARLSGLGLEPECCGRCGALEDCGGGFEGPVLVAGGGCLDGLAEAGMRHVEVEGGVAPVAGLTQREAGEPVGGGVPCGVDGCLDELLGDC